MQDIRIMTARLLAYRKKIEDRQIARCMAISRAEAEKLADKIIANGRKRRRR